MPADYTKIKPVPASIIHGIEYLGQDDEPVALQYGQVTFNILPLRDYPSQCVSVFPMSLTEVVKLDVYVKAPFTAKSFERELRDTIPEMREFFTYYSAHYTPEESKAIQQMINSIEEMGRARENPLTIIRLNQELISYWMPILADKVDWDELKEMLVKIEIEPTKKSRVFSPHDHASKLVARGFDWYFFLQWHPTKDKVSQFLRNDIYHYPTIQPIIFPVTFLPQGKGGPKVRGHLVFAPFLYRTITEVHQLGDVDAYLKASDYVPVINESQYSEETKDRLTTAQKNVGISSRIIPMKIVPPGYRRRDAIHHLSMLEIFLIKVHEIKGESVIHQYRWNYDLMFRVVFGVKYKPEKKFSSPTDWKEMKEMISDIDFLVNALNHVEKYIDGIQTDYTDFRGGAIKRIGQLKAFVYRIPKYQEELRGLEGFDVWF